jgi:hypothetical protein
MATYDGSLGALLVVSVVLFFLRFVGLIKDVPSPR